MQAETQADKASLSVGDAKVSKIQNELVELIPLRYRNVPRSSMIAKPHVKKLLASTDRHCETFENLEQPERGVFAFGSFGTGKTQCLYLIVKSCLLYEYANWVSAWRNIENDKELDQHEKRSKQGKLRKHQIKVLSFRELMNITATERFKREAEYPILDQLCDSHFIFLDDMTVRMNDGNPESPYRWAYEAVNELVDRLWVGGELSPPLYVTSNNTPAELAEAFGHPCFDRITGLCEPVHVVGESFRK